MFEDLIGSATFDRDDPITIINELNRRAATMQAPDVLAQQQTQQQQTPIPPQVIVDRLNRKMMDEHFSTPVPPVEQRQRRPQADTKTQPGFNSSDYGEPADSVTPKFNTSDYGELATPPTEQETQQPQTQPTADQAEWGGYPSVIGRGLAVGAVETTGATLKGLAALAAKQASYKPYYDAYANWDQLSPDQQAAVIKKVQFDTSLPNVDRVFLQQQFMLRGQGEKPKGLGELAPAVKDTGLYHTGEAVEQFGKKQFPLSEVEADSITGRTAKGLGAGATGVGLMLGATALGGPAVGIGVGAAQMGAAAAGGTFDEAMQKGATEEQAAKAAGLNAIASGALGTLPLGTILAPARYLAPGLMGQLASRLEHAVVTGVAFATIGEAQEYLARVIAKEYYDPKSEYKDDWKRVIASFLAGGIIGGVTAHVPKATDDFIRKVREEGDRTTAPGTAPGEPPSGGGTERGRAWRDEIDEFMRARAEREASERGEGGPPKGLPSPETGAPAGGETEPGPKRGPTGGAARADEDAILRRAGYKPDEIAVMDPAQRAGELEEARARGLDKASAEEKPTAEAVKPVEEAAPKEGTRASPVEVKTGADVEKAAAVASQDHSAAQDLANNIQRGHMKWNGLNITIEAPAGGVRKRLAADGTEVETRNGPAPYGNAVGVPVGADGQAPDFYVGPNPERNLPTVVIDEIDPKTGKYRQSKSFVGFPSQGAAVRAYLGTSTKTKDMIGGVRVMQPNELVELAKSGGLARPVSEEMKSAGKTAATPKPSAESVPPGFSLKKIKTEPSRASGELQYQFDVLDSRGKKAGELLLHETADHKSLYVIHVGGGGGPNTMGSRVVRDLLGQIRREFPEAETISGFRKTGARGASGIADDTTIRLKPEEGGVVSGTTESHAEIKTALKAADVKPGEVRPYDVEFAATIAEKEGWSSLDAFRIGLIRSALEDGYGTSPAWALDRMRKAYGPKIAAAVESGLSPEFRARVEESRAGPGGKAAAKPTEGVHGGGKDVEKGSRPEREADEGAKGGEVPATETAGGHGIEPKRAGAEAAEPVARPERGEHAGGGERPAELAAAGRAGERTGAASTHPAAVSEGAGERGREPAKPAETAKAVDRVKAAAEEINLPAKHILPEDLKRAAELVEQGAKPLDALERAALEAERDQGLLTEQQIDDLGLKPVFEAFHGSAHDFERFELSKRTIGTGEGAQAFGHGLYFAELERTARSYRDQLIDRDNKTSAEIFAEYALKDAAADRSAAIRDLKNTIAKYEDAARKAGKDSPNEIRAEFSAGNYRVAVKLLESGWNPGSPEGVVYKVRIRADRERMLDWDRPLSEQSARTQGAVRGALQLHGIEIPESLGKPQEYLTQATGIKEFVPTGAWAYDQLAAKIGKDAASQVFRDAGIPGIKYLDQGSRPQIADDLALVNKHVETARLRLQMFEKEKSSTETLQRAKDELDHWLKNKALLEGKQAQTRNFVIFDDGLVEITHKNGKPVEAAVQEKLLEQIRRHQESGPTAEIPNANVGTAAQGRGETVAAERPVGGREGAAVPEEGGPAHGVGARGGREPGAAAETAIGKHGEPVRGGEPGGRPTTDLKVESKPAEPLERIPGADGIEVQIHQNADGKRFNVVLRDTEADQTVGIKIVNDMQHARGTARGMLNLEQKAREKLAGDPKLSLADKRKANQDAFRDVRFRNKLKKAGEEQEKFEPPYPDVWEKQKGEAGGWKEIGKNADGVTLFEDADGVRSYLDGNVRITEPVQMRPTREGVKASVKRPAEGEWAVGGEGEAAPAEKPAAEMSDAEHRVKLDSVFRAAQALTAQQGGISTVFIGDIQQKTGMALADLHKVLLAAARAGEITLAPSSSATGRLAAHRVSAEIDLPPHAPLRTVTFKPGYEPVVKAPAARPEPKAKTTKNLTSDFAAHLGSGLGFQGTLAARKFARDAGYDHDGKSVEEALEAAVVRTGRDIVKAAGTSREKFEKLVALYGRQPNLGTRTSTSMREQAYSTPIPLAYVASRLAGISRETSVLEPTAGNGALLIEADPRKTVANEINPDRAKGLETQGFKPTMSDASGRAVFTGEHVDRVIANPPFGPVKEGAGSKVFDMGDIQKGYRTHEIDHAIALRALEAMRDDGRAVLILGGINKLARTERARSDAYNGKAKREFFKTLYDRYNVADHFTVAGELYERQGAGWPVDVVVINGRGKSGRKLPAVDVPRVLSTWNEVGGLLDAADRQGAADLQRPAGGPATGTRTGGSSVPDAGVRADVGGQRPAGGVSETGQPGGVRKGPAGGVERGSAAADRGGAEGQPAKPGQPGGPGVETAADRQPPRVRDDIDSAIDAALDDVFGPVEPKGKPSAAPKPTQDLKSRIFDKAVELSPGGRPGRVLLSDLRKAFPDVPHDEMSAALKEMQREDRVILYQMDNRYELSQSPEIAAGALHIGGEPRHILWVPREAFPTGGDKPARADKTGAELARDATRNALDSADAAMAALTEMFGGPKAGMGLGFSPESYAKAKPLFTEAASRFSEFAKDIGELVRRMVQHLRDAYQWTREMLENLRPYLKQFIADVRSGEIKLKEPETIRPETEAAPIKKTPIAPPVETETQVAYQPKSTKTAGLGTLVPVNMAKSMSDSLARVAERRGDIDQFVAKELGYKPDELAKYFGAEQIDAIATALDNIKDGKGFIIGDQTGIGKGRVNAGIIRWAIANNKIPIFVTEKPNLYGDMYRDLTEIGLPSHLGRDMRFLMTNAGETVPLTEDGSVMLRTGENKEHNKVLDAAPRDPKKFLAQYDAVLTNYSQMQTVRGDDTNRRNFLRSIAPNAVIMFDESHNAGGQKSERAPSGPVDRAGFAREMVRAASGVFYSSATYAKRPDVMDLYSATDMSKAVSDPKDIGETIAKGGVPMQQVVASMLAAGGQYVRRERSFAGIRYDTPLVPVNRDAYDGMSHVLAKIQKFSEIVKHAAEEIDEAIKDSAAASSHDNATGNAGAQSVAFTSIMHNIINQLLLANKAKPAAELAIAAIRRGEKPVITVSGTMESFLTDFAKAMQVRHGDAISAGFGDVMKKYLERTRTLIIRKPFAKKGETERRYLSDADLGPAGVAAYREAKKMIGELDLAHLPVSPIDAIKNELEQAGYRVGEITGRGTVIDYADKHPIFKARPGRETSIRGRAETIAAFNNGGFDALIINQAGATGLSLHAGEKFADRRPRHMIIAQPEANIDTHCLDLETEILTPDGFKAHSDEFSVVAAFDQGSGEITWEPVLDRIERPLFPGEKMCAIESPSLSIRVTGDHRMVYARNKSSGWEIETASKLSDRYRSYRIPIAGLQHGAGVPLTDSELQMIGWFLTDGCLNRKSHQLMIWQSEHQPYHDHIKACLTACGLEFGTQKYSGTSQFNETSPRICYYVSKGRNGKKGWGHYERYLDKELSPLLSEISRRQLSVLLETIHFGDGAKCDNVPWTRRSYHVSTGSKVFADRLQSLCVRRGFKCNISRRVGEEDRPFYILHIKDRSWRSVGANNSKDRPILAYSPSSIDERVWCVNNRLGTIVIRRRGKVSIVGNCQLLGRVHRTGQVVLPGYSQLIADIPAEKRPAAVLAKKMASLNANTTASRGSALMSKDVPDFMNEYGDRVAAALIAEDPALNSRLGNPIKFNENGGFDHEDAMRKVTGRIPLLPLAEQDALYNRLESDYHDLLDQMKAAGENALEAQTLDLQAKPVANREVVARKGSGASPFEAPVNMETVSVRRLGKPMTGQEVVARAVEAMGGDPSAVTKENSAQQLQDLASQQISWFAGDKRGSSGRLVEATGHDALAKFDVYRRSILDDIETPERQEQERVRLDAIRDRWHDMSSTVRPGSRVTLKTSNGNLAAIALETVQKGSPKNPLALSTWRTTFAIADASRQITLPFSRLWPDGRADAADSMAIEVRPVTSWLESPAQTLERFDSQQSDARETRHIATGNLLAAYDWLGRRGRIANYTDADGHVLQGILTARDFDLDKQVASHRPTMTTAKQVTSWLADNEGRWLTTEDGSVRLRRDGTDSTTIAIDSARRVGGRYFLDPNLTQLTGDFIKRGNVMVASVPSLSRLPAIIGRLQELGAKFQGAPGEALAGGRSVQQQGPSEGRVQALSPMGEAKRSLLEQHISALVNHLAGPGIEVRFSDTIPIDEPSVGWNSPGLELTADTAGGSYFPVENLIELALRDPTFPDLASASIHESWHAIEDHFADDRQMALLQREEPALTRLAAKRLGVTTESLRGLAGYEIRSNAFDQYAHERAAGATGNNAGLHIGIRRFFERIMDLLRRINNTLRGLGFETYKDIFSAAYEGKMKDRPSRKMYGFGSRILDQVMERERRDAEVQKDAEFEKQFGVKPPTQAEFDAYLKQSRESDGSQVERTTAVRKVKDWLGLAEGERGPETQRDATGHYDLGPFAHDATEPVGGQAQRYVMERGRATSIEHIVAFNRVGAVVAHGFGTETRTGMPERLDAAIRDPRNAIVIHHNHPNDSGLSPTDLAYTAFPGLVSIWAHGHGGTISRGALFPEVRQHLPSDPDAASMHILDVVNLVRAQLYVPFWNALARKKIDRITANAAEGHVIGAIMRRAGIIDYQSNFDIAPFVEKAELEPILDKLAAQAAEVVFNEPQAAIADRRAATARSIGDLGATFDRNEVAPLRDVGPGPSDQVRGATDRGKTPGRDRGLAEEGPIPDPTPEELRRAAERSVMTLGAIGDVRKVAQVARDFWTSTFQPELVNDKALQADPLFAEYKSASAQEKDALVHQSWEDWKWWNKQPVADSIHFLHDVETGAMPADPAKRGRAAYYRRILDENWAEEQRWGSRAAFVIDYFPHVWKRPDKARAWAEARTSQLGPTWFQKKRTYELIQDGLDAGLELKSTNPVDLIVHRLLSGVDMRQRMRLLYQLKELGLAWEGRQGGDMLVARGWLAINAPDRRQWVIAPDVQPLWKNAVEARGLWAQEGVIGGTFRGWMAFKNAWVPVKLALSAFHPLHVLHINYSNGFARAKDELMKNHDIGRALKAAAEGIYGPMVAAPGASLGAITGALLGSVSPVGPYWGALGGSIAGAAVHAAGKRTGLWSDPTHLGKEAIKAWQTRPGDQTAQERIITTLMNEGGFTPQLSEQLKISARKRFLETLQRGQYIRMIPPAMRLAIEKLQAPIFEKWIPQLKAAAYLQQAATLLRARPDLLTDPIQRKAALRVVGRSIDSRYGEMFYGSLFWNRTFKDSMIGSWLSLGWNYGFAQQFLKAPFEAGAQSAQMTGATTPTQTRQTRRWASNALSFVSAYLFSSALINGIMNYLFTGEMPEGADFLFARIGGLNADGSPRRLANMFYLREIPMLLHHIQEHGGNIYAGTRDMIWNKLMFQPLKEIADNKTYYGYEIWDENAPIYKQFFQWAKHFIGDATDPMSISGSRRALDTGGTMTRDVPLAFMGFGPAPAYVEKTAVQNRIAYLFKQFVVSEKKDFESGETSEAKMRARNQILMALQKNDQPALNSAYKAAMDAGMTSKAIEHIGKTPSDVVMFKRLPDSQQRAILNMAEGAEFVKYVAQAHKTIKMEFAKRYEEESKTKTDDLPTEQWRAPKADPKVYDKSGWYHPATSP